MQATASLLKTWPLEAWEQDLGMPVTDECRKSCYTHIRTLSPNYRLRPIPLRFYTTRTTLQHNSMARVCWLVRAAHKLCGIGVSEELKRLVEGNMTALDEKAGFQEASENED
ncbi:hypothetical protein NDU88_001484 [Pleurodeles waltl]|uniref:Uncharacterized protein n=1 Tax=Pleurodeles waltl TaxID=8319 RepID=A0AAV7LYS2_PLEWA|nr:hypothetical protein NDU88_001484 [Pleurodeles waltl]